MCTGKLSSCLQVEVVRGLLQLKPHRWMRQVNQHHSHRVPEPQEYRIGKVCEYEHVTSVMCQVVWCMCVELPSLARNDSLEIVHHRAPPTVDDFAFKIVLSRMR